MAITQSSIVGNMPDYTTTELKGVKGFKGEKGDKGFAPVVARGYASGGRSGPVSVNTIDSFPFSTPFTTATDVGDISQSRSGCVGQSSDDDGYTSGGRTVPPFTLTRNTIDSFPFSTPFTTATDVGDLSQSRYSAAGQSSSTDGHTSGGQAPPLQVVNVIDSFPFSTPFTTATDVGDLSLEIRQAAGQNSISNGYASGGFNPFASQTPTGAISTVDRFPFSSPFTSATDIGDLSQGRYGAAGQSSSDHGYTSGGYTPGLVVIVDRFPFSTPFTTATDVGDISQGRYLVAGHSSETKGYTSGGSSYPDSNVVDSFPFSTPFTTATDVGDLSQARYAATGQQG